MLDNLRAMAVFASVVQHGSFGGAGKELGITTSAVSQQIRALESELGVVLLHRSTRKLSLTEAGASLYESAKNIVKSAEEARDNISQLRDGLLGNLRIATTPKLAREHVLPALATWLGKHEDLSLMVFTGNHMVDMIDKRVDLAIYFDEPDKEIGVPLVKVEQIFVASPKYLNNNPAYEFADLSHHQFIGQSNNDTLTFGANAKEILKLPARFGTSDDSLALSLAKDGYGILKTNTLDVKDMLRQGELVQVFSEVQLPKLVLHAKTLNKEQQPAKVWRCVEVLTEYFSTMA